MSIFKTKWVVLKINKITWKDFLYTIFTYDYWIIRASKKKSWNEKAIDLWYLINFEVETKEKRDIHRIRNIKISLEFICENKNFATINAYLTLLWTVLNNTPIWVPIYEISEIIEAVLNYDKINETKLTLARLKIINILWNLDINHKNITVARILKFINNNKIWEILRLSWISKEVERELIKIN